MLRTRVRKLSPTAEADGRSIVVYDNRASDRHAVGIASVVSDNKGEGIASIRKRKRIP
jgi:hypothetical protein